MKTYLTEFCQFIRKLIQGDQTTKQASKHQKKDSFLRVRKLSDSFVQHKIKPKILFAPSTHFGEKKKKKERREEKSSLMMRNFRQQGRKVVNLGDTEIPRPHSSEDLTIPDMERFVDILLLLLIVLTLIPSYKVVMLGGPGVGKSTISTKFGSSAHSRNLKCKDCYKGRCSLCGELIFIK